MKYRMRERPRRKHEHDLTEEELREKMREKAQLERILKEKEEDEKRRN